jgi:hypothetical protein
MKHMSNGSESVVRLAAHATFGGGKGRVTALRYPTKSGRIRFKNPILI